MPLQNTMDTPISPSAFTSANSNNQQASGNFVAFQCISSACHAILNTRLASPSPKPEWFDDLEVKLQSAQALAGEWVDRLAPEMTSGIPSMIIDYGTSFRTVSDEIISLLKEHPEACGKEHPAVNQVTELITVLITKVDKMLVDVNRMDEQLKEWSGKMQRAHRDLQDGTMNIQKLHADLQADITAMNEAIAALNGAIDAHRKAMTSALLTAGAGLFVGSIGIGLAPFTLGGSLLVGGLGGAAFLGGIGVSVYLGVKIGQEMKKISENQAKIAENQRQIVALGGLYMATQGAVGATATATEKISDVRMVWGALREHLQLTVNHLNSTDDKMSGILNALAVKMAQKEWENAISYARGVMQMTVTVENIEVPMAA